MNSKLSEEICELFETPINIEDVERVINQGPIKEDLDPRSPMGRFAYFFADSRQERDRKNSLLRIIKNDVSEISLHALYDIKIILMANTAGTEPEILGACADIACEMRSMLATTLIERLTTEGRTEDLGRLEESAIKSDHVTGDGTILVAHVTEDILLSFEEVLNERLKTQN